MPPKMKHAHLWNYLHLVTIDHEGGANGFRDMLRTKQFPNHLIMRVRYLIGI